MAKADTSFDPKWLRTPNARADKLKVRPKPYFTWIAPGTQLGYRRNASGGSWCLRDRTDGNDRVTWLAQADDGVPEHPPAVLGYTKAMDEARKLVGAPAAKGEKPEKRNGPITVYDALGTAPTKRDPDVAYTGYAADLHRRGGDSYNAIRARNHMPKTLGNRAVALLGKGELEGWIDRLAETLAPSTVNRTRHALFAALNLVARDPANNIHNATAIRAGLACVADVHEARNVVLSEADEDRFVAGCYAHHRKLGILADVLRETGARPGQAARLLVRDLVRDPDAPRLQMPKSGKGGSRTKRAERKAKRYAVSITPELAAILADEAKGRKPDAVLLTRADGAPWGDDPHNVYGDAVKAIVAKLKLDPDATLYALRHTRATRMLLDNVNVRVVASLLDTSVAQIERSYSAHIPMHADEIARRSLRRRSPAESAAGNVVKLDARR
jgi:integrase